MKYRIIHTNTYKYTGLVKLSPHTIRMTPKNAHHLMVHSFNINIYPQPSLLYPIEETDGALPMVACFKEETDYLHVEHVSEVSVSTFNPFNFIVKPDIFTRVPFPHMHGYFPDTVSYSEKPVLSAELKDFIESTAKESDYSSVTFALNICSKIPKLIAYTKRVSGKPQDADETFNLKTGSCRDISYLFLIACRYMNIPSRYVSGYTLCEHDSPELHSWVDLYFPGGGWVAFDPTGGIAFTGNHVPLSASSDPALTLPLSGVFTSVPGVQSELSYSLKYVLLER